MNKVFRSLCLLSLLSVLSFSGFAADKYAFDVKGAHASVMFKVSHLGYSWIYGRFNDFDGYFELDEDDVSKSKVSVTINTKSLDSNHAERDKHIRGDDFLNTSKFPEATFESTKVSKASDGGYTVEGNFTLMGVTQAMTLSMAYIGGGSDPWGGFRKGFEGTASFNTAPFGMKYKKAASMNVDLVLVVEGVRQ